MQPGCRSGPCVPSAREDWHRTDADVSGDEYRLVQFTPPGSARSIQFGSNLTPAPPGSAHGLLLASPTSRPRAGRGAEITGASVPACRCRDGVGEFERPAGPAPGHASYGSFATFSDPDGSCWMRPDQRTGRCSCQANETAQLTNIPSFGLQHYA